MRTKMLLAPAGKRSSFIAAVDGELRVIDPPPPCHGYANCCVCVECVERARIARAPVRIVRQPWQAAA